MLEDHTQLDAARSYEAQIQAFSRDWSNVCVNVTGSNGLRDHATEEGARLIAAAPAMLDALKGVLANMHCIPISVFEKCCEAFEKAEGRDSA